MNMNINVYESKYRWDITDKYGWSLDSENVTLSKRFNRDVLINSIIDGEINIEDSELYLTIHVRENGNIINNISFQYNNKELKFSKSQIKYKCENIKEAETFIEKLIYDNNWKISKRNKISKLLTQLKIDYNE